MYRNQLSRGHGRFLFSFDAAEIIVTICFRCDIHVSLERIHDSDVSQTNGYSLPYRMYETQTVTPTHDEQETTLWELGESGVLRQPETTGRRRGNPS